MSQSARDQAMAAFRSGRSDVLVATNVAARGLDIRHVGLVVNYDLPETPEALTHRLGRTARMGNEGRALTFLAPDDAVVWRRLRGQGAPDLPELDIEHLLQAGGWRYAPAAMAPAEHLPALVQPAPGRPARQRYRGRRRGRPRQAHPGKI
jgi:superfamily II DNA/RNA helicase